MENGQKIPHVKIKQTTHVKTTGKASKTHTCKSCDSHVEACAKAFTFLCNSTGNSGEFGGKKMGEKINLI